MNYLSLELPFEPGNAKDILKTYHAASDMTAITRPALLALKRQQAFQAMEQELSLIKEKHKAMVHAMAEQYRNVKTLETDLLSRDENINALRQTLQETQQALLLKTQYSDKLQEDYEHALQQLAKK